MPNYIVSEIIDPIVPLRTDGGRNTLSAAIRSLPVGKAILIGGTGQSELSSRANAVGVKCEPRRKFTTTLLPDGRVQLARIE